MTDLPFAKEPNGPLAVTLRPYQQEAVDGLYTWFAKNDGNPLVVVPTGGGKSLIIAAFAHSVLGQWPNERILVLTHVRELIDQNYRAMLRAWPGAPAGIYSAGMKRREHDARLLFAGIQSTYQKAGLIGWVDLCIIDECHRIPKAGFGMYRELLDALKAMNSNLKVIGLSATPFRTGEGSLDKGPDRLFHGVAYECEIVRLIRDKWLSPVTSKATAARIDTSELHVRMGEFIESEIEAAAMAGDLVPKACREIVARSADRKAWLVFCCSVAHANAVATELRSLGVTTETVFGETDADERDRIIASFKAGKLRCIVNVNVLTTGFDAPHVDLIALLRPTMSPVLYIQMVGRGLRIAEGKVDCIVLDFGGNVMRHGPIDAIRIREPRQSDPRDQVLARECPNCQTLVSIAVRQCPECGFEWVVIDGEQGGQHADVPDEGTIIAGLELRNPIERWNVQVVNFRRHEKPGKPATLCVEYHGWFQQSVREWVCFDHPAGSFPRRKASAWWKDRGGLDPVPANVEEALFRIQDQHELFDVLGVTVDTRSEWPELRGVRLSSEPGLNEAEEPRLVDKVGDGMSYDEIPF